MPLVAVPVKQRDYYVNACLEVKNAKTYDEYQAAEKRAKWCCDVIKDWWPDAWFIIICEADEAVGENACCGIVYRTESDFPKESP